MRLNDRLLSDWIVNKFLWPPWTRRENVGRDRLDSFAESDEQ
jgi:hypothetical protein